VEGGHRAIVFNRFVGIKEQVLTQPTLLVTLLPSSDSCCLPQTNPLSALRLSPVGSHRKRCFF
jgi:hypothetical protein